MTIVRTIIIFLTVIIPVVSWADITVFMYPRINFSGDILYVGDIARFDADPEVRNAIIKIELAQTAYSDGIIDSSEVIQAIKPSVNCPIHVTGSGTRIIKQDILSNNSIAGNGADINIQAGAPVMFVVVKKGIRLEIPGQALGAGIAGEMITVKLSNLKIVKGIIKSQKTVELEL